MKIKDEGKISTVLLKRFPDPSLHARTPDVSLYVMSMSRTLNSDDDHFDADLIE